MKRCIFVFCLLFCCALTALSAPIYKYENTVPITDTVSLTNVREFHADKNISYSYIKADLTDEHTSITLLKSGEGTDILETVENLVLTNENTVAAVNGDFFSIYSGRKGFSLGIEYQDGVLYESPIYPETMATVAYDGMSLLMTHFDYELKISNADGIADKVRHVNKHTSYYGDILMYTSTFNAGYSPAPGGDVLEVVVEDNVIVEFRRNMASTEIPENGCVFVVSEGNNMFFANNFEVGDEIFVELVINPSLENVKTAFGGGSMLVYEGKDVGKIGDYTHTVAGFNPRTAIGVDEAGTTVYLVTVDGRQGISKGMRMSHLAELLIDLGCYYAVNLDGGGSTRMVASTLENSTMHTVNNPTENRKVINAVGITFEPGDNSGIPNGIYLTSDKEYAYIGQQVEISAYLHDENLRRVEEFENEIELNCDYGRIEDGILYCDEGVTVTVTAVYEDLFSEISVDFVDSIAGFTTEKSLTMKKGDEYKISITAFDEIGRTFFVDDCFGFNMVSSDNNVVSVDESGVITAENNGIAEVYVQKNGIECVITIAVGYYEYDYRFGFENDSGRLVTYPETSKGSYSISEVIKFSEKYAGKLTYDFRDADNGLSEQEASGEYEGLFDIVDDYISDNSDAYSKEDEESSSESEEDVAKAVYYELEKPVRLSDDCDAVCLNVYTVSDFKHSLRAQFTDANGRIAIVPFTGEYVSGTWRGFAAYIPEDMARPLSLTRVYVLYTPGEEKDNGEIYIDDLSFTASKDYISGEANHNSYVNDLSNSNVASVIRIGAFPTDENLSPLSNVIKSRVGRAVLECDFGLLIGDGAKKGVFEDETALYVRLDTSEGGIRNTDETQWNTMFDAVMKSDKDNLFLLSDNSIFGNDKFENEVLCDWLASCGKNVFVVTGGDSASYMNIKGVKYLTLDRTADYSFDGLISNSYSVVEFLVGDNVTFEFLPV